MRTIKVQAPEPEPAPKRDFNGYLRCDTCTQHQGKNIIILIKPKQLNDKKKKYPKLIVQGVVRE